MIKNIIKNLTISSTLRINEISKELESEGKKIYKFGFGQSPFKVPENVIIELQNNAYRNQYLPMQGLPELRQAIAKFVSSRKNYEYKEENILIGPGTKELMFLLHILFDGEVLLPAPSWVSYEPQAIIGRNKVHWINTTRENNWFPIAEDIEKIVHPLVSRDRLSFMENEKRDILVFEIPLLYETKGQNAMDAVACVNIDKNIQRERVLSRGTMGNGQFEKILSKQIPTKEKLQKADFEIVTDSFENVEQQVLKIIKHIRESLNARNST